MKKIKENSTEFITFVASFALLRNGSSLRLKRPEFYFAFITDGYR